MDQTKRISKILSNGNVFFSSDEDEEDENNPQMKNEAEIQKSNPESNMNLKSLPGWETFSKMDQSS